MSAPLSPTDEPPVPRAAATPPAGSQVTVGVQAAWDFPVTLGAGLGAGLGRPDGAVPGDRYRLAPTAAIRSLALTTGPGPGPGPTRVAPGSELGQPGQPVAARGEHRLVAADGEVVTVIALALPGLDLVLPLSPLAPGVDYTLIDSRPPPAGLPLPDRVAAAFARGTAVVLADGSPCPVERLAPGMAVLTRDHAGQPLRAVLHARMRAAGDAAPVVFAPGTIGNAGELAVSPFHRILLCQPFDGGPAAGADRLVQARRLVDGDRIRQREGGQVDYYGLVFDRHEVVFVEGFPCESLCLAPAVAARLPAAMRAALPADAPCPAPAPHPAPEQDRADLSPWRR